MSCHPSEELESTALSVHLPASAATPAATHSDTDAADSDLVASLRAQVASQKIKLSEWKHTLSSYRAWHDRVLAAAEQRHRDEIDQLRRQCGGCSCNRVQEKEEEEKEQEDGDGKSLQVVISRDALIVSHPSRSPSRASDIGHTSLVPVETADTTVALPGTALTAPFPAPLKAGASTKQHLANLFAQVHALQSQLREAPAAKPTLRAAEQKQLGTSATVVQQVQTASKSTASIESASDDASKSVLSLQTVTRSLCTTSEVDSLLATMSQQFSSLSASSTSVEDLLRNVAGQIATYHGTIHQLTSQVAHLDEKAHEVDRLRAEMAEKDGELAEAKRLLGIFMKNMADLHTDLNLYAPSRDPDADNGVHFFASLHLHIVQLCERIESLTHSLHQVESSHRTLYMLYVGERDQAAKWHLEVTQQRRMQADLDAMRAQCQLVAMHPIKAAKSERQQGGLSSSEKPISNDTPRSRARHSPMSTSPTTTAAVASAGVRDAPSAVHRLRQARKAWACS